MTTTLEPVALRPGDRVAIVAGSGRLPEEVAERLLERGISPFAVLVEGEVAPASTLFQLDHHPIALEDGGRLLSVLKRSGATHVVLAGGIERRPQLRRIRPSLGLLKFIRRMLPVVLRGGDDLVLRTLVSVIESGGIRVVGAHEIVPDILAREGPLGRERPQRGDIRDLEAGLAAARAIGALDIGQAAVSIGGRVVALEGIEGTAGLLERVRDLRNHGRLAGRGRGVLVKCAKPGQELRADLPAIGPDTVDQAHAAGLAGIGVEAGRSIVLDHGQMRERADALGLFVVGLGQES